MTSKLASKVAGVTGGSAGIGPGITKRFAQEGARLLTRGSSVILIGSMVSIKGFAACSS